MGDNAIADSPLGPYKKGGVIIYDKFGEDIKIQKISDGWLKCNVEIQISPTFFSWLAGTSLGTSKKGIHHMVYTFFGDPPETRTPDPLIKSQVLYRLS